MKKQGICRSHLSIRLSLLLAFCFLVAATASAQTRTQSQTPARRQQPSTDSADISLTATVRARELLFEIVPSPTVEFPGTPRRDTVWEGERTNFPTPVQPGVTYRNITVTLTITSSFADIERIVSEALGESPSRESAPPRRVEPPAAPRPASGLTPKRQTGGRNQWEDFLKCLRQ